MKKGDPITLVYVDQVILRELLFAPPDGDYILVGPHRLLRTDEGVHWLKGWHKPDEDCVSAARTCQSLREEEERKAQPEIPPFGLPPMGPPQPQPPPPQPAPLPWVGGGTPHPTWIGAPVLGDHIVTVTTDAKGLF